MCSIILSYMLDHFELYARVLSTCQAKQFVDACDAHLERKRKAAAVAKLAAQYKVPAQPQYVAEMKAIWDHVETQWGEQGPKIAGYAGHEAVHCQNVKLAHPAIPVPIPLH